MANTDLGSEIKTVYVSSGDLNDSWGAYGDEDAVVSDELDLIGFKTSVLSFAYKTKLALAETLKATISYQTGETSALLAAADVVTLLDDETLETGVNTAAVYADDTDMNRFVEGTLDRYVQFTVTPNLSDESADELYWSLQLIKGGPDTIPTV